MRHASGPKGTSTRGIPLLQLADYDEQQQAAAAESAASQNEAIESEPSNSETAVSFRNESLLQVISHEVDTKRIVVVMVEAPDRTYLVLRQQEWAAGIGWFTQKSIELEAEQLGPLRCTLQVCDQCKPRSNKRAVAEKMNQRGLRIVS